MKTYLLGIDNGLTATKAVLYDLRGTQAGIASLPTKLLSARAGWSEIDLREQWETCCAVIRQVIASTGIAPAEIAAIGVSGYGNGAHVLDGSGQPLGNGITSMDHRALEMVNDFPAEAKDVLQRLTLQGVWDAQPGMLLRWMKLHQPERYRQVKVVLLCKDWLQFCLTGNLSADYTDSSAAGLMNNLTKAYDREILDILGIPEMYGSLPPVIESHGVSGKVTQSAAEQTGLISGIPVVAGMFDVAANSLGAGLTQPGQFCTIAGTWNINIAIGQQALTPRKIRQCTVYADSDFYAYVDSSATSASNLEWFMQRVLCKSCGYDEFERIIARYAPEEVDLIFLPFVYSGLRNDAPGAMFAGLKNYHGRDEMLRAIAEGIGFAHHYHIRNLLSEGIAPGDTLIFTGGASQNRHWCQLFADIMQMRVTVPESDQTGALGDCIMAGVGAGIFSDIPQAVKEMVRIRAVYEPNPERADAYQRKYERFVELLERL